MATSPPTIMKLQCRFVGVAHSGFVIEIDSDEYMFKALKKVKEAHSDTINYSANFLRACVACESGQWLSVSDPIVAALEAGDIPPVIKPLLMKGEDSTHFGRISRHISGHLPDDAIHLLIYLPGALVAWLPEMEPVFVLDNHKLYLANRESTVETLQRVHLDTSLGRTVDGLAPSIALADNMAGLGKTVFSHNYLWRCRQSDVSTRPPHLQTLCDSHHVHVLMTPGLFADPSTTESRFRSLVLQRIDEKLQSSTDSDAVITRLRDTSDFAGTLVALLGPVFISVDWINKGAADRTNHMEARAQFYQFCSTVVLDWMKTKQIFFLLTGHAFFLSAVPEQRTQTGDSPITFTRLPLPLLHFDDIELVLERTLVDERKKQPLRDCWALSQSQGMATAARLLYASSCGNPRRLMELLCEYMLKTRKPETTAPFLEYVASKLPIHLDDIVHYQDKFRHELKQWRDLLRQWVPLISTSFDASLASETVDLSQTVSENGTDVSLLVIASRCYIGWGGTLTEATLYASQPVFDAILHSVYPLREYVDYVGQCQRRLFDYGTVFEWMCVKRMLELFSTPTTASAVLPAFFDSTTLLGGFGPVCFTPDVLPLPMITAAPQFSMLSFDARAAHPNQWTALMEQIGKTLQSTGSATFKLPRKSESAHALFFYRDDTSLVVAANQKKRKVEPRVRTIVVGLAIRASTLDAAGLDDEVAKFDRMFQQIDTLQTYFGQVTSVLLACATDCAPEVKSLFETGQSFMAYEILTRHSVVASQAIVLDLTSSAKLAQFFGFEPDGDRLETVLKAIQQRDAEGVRTPPLGFMEAGITA